MTTPMSTPMNTHLTSPMTPPRALPRTLTRSLTAAAFGLLLPWVYAGDGQISMTSSEYRTPVVELYTSEGCSSCPSADDWLRQLGESLDQDFNAVPLAFHVDYWNYLGWTDPYSKPSFTERQREVAANNRQRSLYTPEFLVDGQEARRGGGIIQSIYHANSQKAKVTIVVNAVSHDLNQISTRIEVDNQSELGNADAYIAVYENGITRKIGGGENHGKTLKHDFVVRHWSAPIAIRRGANNAAVDLEIPADWKRPNLGLAVLVLDRDSGETLQAVNGSLAALFPG